MELNVVHHADCFDILPYIDNTSIDMILCDLPYNMTHAKWDKALNIEKEEKWIDVIKKRIPNIIVI